MSTTEVRLVPALPEHLDTWIAIRAGATTRRLVAIVDESRESLLKRLREASSDVTAPQAKSFRWMVEADGHIAGIVSARKVSRVHGRVELSFMLAEEFIGHGIGTRAVALMLKCLFTLPWLQRVGLNTTSENLATQALARKLGFRLEGVRRGHYVVQGRRVDQQVWGLLRSEWRNPMDGEGGGDRS